MALQKTKAMKAKSGDRMTNQKIGKAAQVTEQNIGDTVQVIDQVNGKELVRDMKYLVKLLHKEWERSGVVKSNVVITLEDAAAINRRLAEQIMKKSVLLEQQELTFRESMTLSKENFILLRLVKKIKKEEDKTNKKGINLEFSVPLDKEEQKLFLSIIQTKE